MMWRMWFWDGSSVEGSTWDDAVAVAEAHPDDVLVRMLYYDDGGKQIQHGTEYYFVAPHPSGEPIYGASSHDDIAERYPGAIIQRGKWAPDGFYRRLLDEEVHPAAAPCKGCD